MVDVPTRPQVAVADRPWLEAGLDIESRVDLLLGVLTLPEKVAQLHQVANLDPTVDRELIATSGVSSALYASGATAGNVRDRGLMVAAITECQRIAVGESRLGIPLLFGRDVIHGHRTIFPIPLGLAATFDPDLARACCRVAAMEAAADGVGLTFAPMADISEEPRWGRVAESLGEQPVLAGRMAAAMVRGFQGEPRTSGSTVAADAVAACAKHFVGYGMSTGGRDYDTVQVGENTLRNVHLRPFKDAVDAGCLTVMASFNDIDGVPMHAHGHLLRDVLKGEWGFDGVVVADWNGVGQLVSQGVAADLRDAARQAIAAGVDLDMTSGAYAAHLAELVEAGEVAIDLLDDAVRRVLRLKFRLALFERPYPEAARGDGRPSDEGRALARRAAVGSFVLVKNDGILPLTGDPGRIHLAGPFVHEGDALLGTWVLDGKGDDVASPAWAFRERLARDQLLVSDGRFSDVAIGMVRTADVTIALMGEHPSRSGEDRCLSTIELPAGQLDVIRQMAGIGKPLVVVVFTGRPLELGPVMDMADAVLVAWHPGIEAGPALADVLFGDAEPGGRLPITFPRSVGHIPSSSLQRPTGRPIQRDDDRTSGRYLDSLVYTDLVFGFGLGYTTFSYGPPVASAMTIPLGSSSRRQGITVTVTVTNIGRRRGTETVQLYVRDLAADVTRPLLELAAWRRVEIASGRTRTVSFSVEAEMFGYYDRRMRWRVDPGDVEVIVGPDAARGQRVRLALIEGAGR